MQAKPITIEQLRELINKGEAKDPLVFLESVMNGQDPRKLSAIYELVDEIHSFSNGQPEPADWMELYDFVVTRYKYQNVNIAESMSAAKTLAEYLYPKRKQIESSGLSGSGADPAKNPLTEEEIELFKEKFNEEF